MMLISDAEPFEVFMLKKQLANLTCHCSVCEKLSPSESSRETIESNGSNKQTQAGQQIDVDFKNNIDAKVDFLCNNVSCPGCYIALNLLKARETKICKDEVSETKSGLSCCDKSTEKCVKFMERTTSTSSITKASLKNSYMSLNEKTTNTSPLNGIMKKRSNDHVKFLTGYVDNDVPNRPFIGNCFCLQNFMDSIRPPLTDPE